MKVAAAHVSPEFMDAAATTKKAVDWIEQAQHQGLDLIVFPEAFIPGFPVSHVCAASMHLRTRFCHFAPLPRALITAYYADLHKLLPAS